MIGKLFRSLFFIAFIAICTIVVMKVTEQNQMITEPSLALVELTGVIYESETIVEMLRDVERDPMVKGLMIRVNSPGGMVAPSQEMYAALRNASKPVWAYYDGLAASGALYSTLAAARIGTQGGTITGSIGVILSSVNASELFRKIGLERITVKSGRFKDLLGSENGLSEEGRLILDALVDDTHQEFIQAISDSRNIPLENVKTFADGRVFTGRHALELGLVDEVTSFAEFRQKMADEFGVSVENYLEREKSDWDWLGDLLSGAKAGTQLMYLFE